MLVTIERRICIDHKFLNNDIRKYILDKIKEVTFNECTKDYGYILDVKKVVKIKDNYVSNANCDNIFTILFEADTLKPENGKEYEGIVCMIFAGGIFFNIKNKQKVLIPITNLKEFIFDQTKKQFKKEKVIIKEGDVLNVIITGTKYSKKSFSCFGNLVENKI